MNVLIVSYGSIGKRHARILSENFKNLRIGIFRNSSCKDLEDFECFNKIEDAILFNPKLVIICSPASFHKEMVLKFSPLNADFLIEKPLSDSIKNAKEILSSISQNSSKYHVGYNLRFSESLLAFRNLIREKVAGEIYSISCSVGQNLEDWRDAVDYRYSVSAKRNLGGGVLRELSHEIDYLGWLFGGFTWVLADVRKTSYLDVDVEDMANVIFAINSEEYGEINGTLNLDFFRRDSKRLCEVVGERGTLLWDGVLNQVNFFCKDEKSWRVLYSEKTDRDHTYLEQFKSIFEQKFDNLCNIDDAIKTLEVIEAVEDSNMKGVKVHIS